MKVLVTGGAGFIGSHTAEQLAARGDGVVVLDDFDPYYDPARKRRTAALLEAAGVEVREGSFDDPGIVGEALEDVEAVIHLGARPGVRASIEEPRRTFQVNVMGTLTLLEAMRARPRSPALVFASSSSVYGGDAQLPFQESMPASRPLSPYAASKRAGELLCATYAERFGLGVVALRFFTVYGPRGRPDMAIGKFLRLALLGRPVPLFGDGSVVRDFTYVDDIVRGVLAALELARGGPGFELLNIGGGVTHTMSELVALIEEVTGTTLEVERRPPAPSDMPRTQADLTRSRERLGFGSQVPLDEGLRRTVAWMRSELEAERGAEP